MTLYWISFAGDQGLLGVVLVDADDAAAALEAATAGGVNPGGEALVLPLPVADDNPQAVLTRALPRLTLLSTDDIEAASVRCSHASEMSDAGHAALRDFAELVVCDDCNDKEA